MSTSLPYGGRVSETGPKCSRSRLLVHASTIECDLGL